MNESLEARVRVYLREHRTMTVATIGPDGPWSATVFFVNDGLDFWWLSKPGARHSLNLAGDPRAAATIQEDYRRPGVVKGIQMEGIVAGPTAPAAATRIMRLYLDKFPPGGEGALPLLSAIKAFAASRVYQFVPTRAYFIDNSLGMGHRDELSIPAQSATAAAHGASNPAVGAYSPGGEA
ncbi:MAG: pyridoxamine 5'-phosphate oxidase family protein [Blastocatellia bacterium]